MTPQLDASAAESHRRATLPRTTSTLCRMNSTPLFEAFDWEAIIHNLFTARSIEAQVSPIQVRVRYWRCVRSRHKVFQHLVSVESSRLTRGIDSIRKVGQSISKYSSTKRTWSK